MKAVIYARYSSDNQREESIEGQIRECTAFAEKNGMTVLRHYIDRAYSAKTDNRPEFQRMIQDSREKLFDIVLVWKLDRFARNRYDSAQYKNILKKNGVRVVSANEAISDSSEGILMESILEGFAEYFSADLAEKVSRGMTENALKCKFNGGNPTVGYLIDSEQHFQIDPVKAPFVLNAFKMYDEGSTMSQIRDYLNEYNVCNNRGGKHTINSVAKILKNRRYIGEYSYRDVVIPNGIPAIVPEDLFDRVQEKIEKNKKAPARHKAADDYLLTTKLFCGYCGAYMCGESGRGRNGTVHHYYKCVSVKKKRTDCKKKPVKKDWIENLVISQTMKLVNDEETVKAIATMLRDMQERENTNLPLLTEQLREAQRGIDNLLNAIQQGIFTKSTKSRLEELEAAKEELEIRIANEKLVKPKLTEEQILFYLHKFRVLDMSKQSHRQRLIDTFINRIYLYDDKLVITFNHKDGAQTITLGDIETALAEQENGSDLVSSAVPKNLPVSFETGKFFVYCIEEGTRTPLGNVQNPHGSKCFRLLLPMAFPICAFLWIPPRTNRKDLVTVWQYLSVLNGCKCCAWWIDHSSRRSLRQSFPGFPSGRQGMRNCGVGRGGLPPLFLPIHRFSLPVIRRSHLSCERHSRTYKALLSVHQAVAGLWGLGGGTFGFCFAFSSPVHLFPGRLRL